MATADIPKPAYAHNMRAIGHSDQGGRPDAVQVMVNKGHAYVEPPVLQRLQRHRRARPDASPRRSATIPARRTPGTCICQTYDDLLLVVHAKNMWAQPELADERNYYKGKTDFHAQSEAKGERNWSAGMAVYDISKPAEPRQIGFMPIDGGGIHRIWYVGGRWAYASALIEGFSDYIFITIDMQDPTNPREAGPLLAAGHEPRRRREDRTGRPRPAATAATTASSTATPPIAPGATPTSSSSTSTTAATRSSSSTRAGRRRSRAAPTTACRSPIATCCSCSTRPSSTRWRTA